MDILWTKITNTIGISTVWVNSDRQSKIQNRSVIVLLLIITIIYDYYAKHRS